MQNEMNNHSFLPRVAHAFSLQSGACRTTAAWMVRCGRCCIHHIEYIPDSQSNVRAEKGLYSVSGYSMRERGHVVIPKPMHIMKYCVNRNANRVSYYIYISLKKSLEESRKAIGKWTCETPVRTKTQQKMCEIAAPSPNQRKKTRSESKI